MNKILIGTIILISLIVVGCSSNTPSTDSSSSSSSKSNSSTTATAVAGDMTLEELAKYNGQNGVPAYVAVSGVIYDVTNAKAWQNGMHKNGIKAGADLTKLIAKSPHGVSVLKNLPVVGKLK